MKQVPEVGQFVEVRNRQFVVSDVEASSSQQRFFNRTEELKQHLVSLSSLDDEGLGEELQVIWELEPGTSIHDSVKLPEVTGFDHPDKLESFLDSMRWGASSVSDKDIVQSPFRSGISIEDYQLDPLLRAIQMPRVNLLIADDVGLGKTIEAGLVIQEMVFRHKVRTCLIICPSSLQLQWKDQMREKFGLDFRIIDSEYMKELRRRRGLHVNPWTHFPRLITSIDYIKRDRPFRLFKDVLPSRGESIYPRKFDMLVVDEAHRIAPSSAGSFSVDSARTSTIREISNHFEHKLFLTATPHNGYSDSFLSLLEILDNQRFVKKIKGLAKGEDVFTDKDRNQLSKIMVRRLKRELPPNWDGTPRFPERKIKPIEVNYSDEDKNAHKLLTEYIEQRKKESGNTNQGAALDFITKLLKKRLFSSPEAFFLSIKKHEESLNKKNTFETNISRIERIESELEDDFDNDETLSESLEQIIEEASIAFNSTDSSAIEKINKLKEYSSRASNKGDSKFNELKQWLKTHIKPNNKWSDNRVIIFTEYRDTQKWLYNLLAAAGFATNDRLLMMYGGMDSKDREAVKAAFMASPKDSNVRILLATDAAAEGLDLHLHCSRLIHYEIPWNPNRMEQRNGRVDRHGQTASEVEIFHFVGKGYESSKKASKPGELEGDLEYLFRASLKVDTIREDLGKVGPVIADQVVQAMLGKRADLDTADAEAKSKSVKKLLTFERKLKEELEKLVEKLRESKKELRIDAKNVKQLIDLGLQLAGQPPLVEGILEGVWPTKENSVKECPVFVMPKFRGSWTKCGAGLEHPHTKKIRPIVFEQSLVKNRDDVILVHLNHPLTQMCIKVIRAELWKKENEKNLHRVAVKVVPDSFIQKPSIICFGRLLILGGSSNRLHEEIVSSGSYIEGGDVKDLNVGETNQILSINGESASDKLCLKIGEIIKKNKSKLDASLAKRASTRSSSLRANITKKFEKEMSDVELNFTELIKQINNELEVNEKDLENMFPEIQEMIIQERQLKLDFGNLRRRLEQLPQELEKEKEGIKQKFENLNERLFPICIMALIPESAAREISK